MSGLKVSHKTLSLSEKFDLISKFEKGVKRVALEQEYGIGQSSVYRIIKNKEIKSSKSKKEIVFFSFLFITFLLGRCGVCP